MLILAINPGGTSTKIAVFQDEIPVFSRSIIHDYELMKEYAKVFDQFSYRKELIMETLKNNKINVETLNAVVGRGGLMKPIPGGTYEVCLEMIEDMKNEIMGEHASNLGAALAYSIGNDLMIPSYVVDPVAVNEFLDISKITGLKEIEKQSWLHTLNHKAVCRKIASQLGGKYEDYNFIVAHLGSGNSVAAHRKGVMVDGSGGRSDGPFSPERSGGLLAYPLIELCFSGKYTREELVNMVSNEGGFYSYLGTKDMVKIEKIAADGDDYANTILEAYYYQIAKEISMYAPILSGHVDRIIITGGISRSECMVKKVSDYVSYLAPVEVVPGELEMEALVAGALRVLNGEEVAKDYMKV